MFGEEKERKPIPMRVKRQVYERAKGKCEKCGRPLEMKYGDFHHIRDPTVTPRAKTVRFLCPTCHRMYGHKRKTIKRDGLLWTEKKIITKRQEVVKIRKPAKKKPKTKRVAIRGIFGNVIGYRTVKVRKPKTTKKKTTTRKTKKKTTSRKATKPKRTTKKKKITRKKTKSKTTKKRSKTKRRPRKKK